MLGSPANFVRPPSNVTRADRYGDQVTNAVVVGSGPNGLAAALTLASSGVRVRVFEAADTIGGGTRSSEHTAPGLIHDDCSAVHPMGVASPFFANLGLDAYGLRWLWPEIQLAHPLDDGRAALLWQDVERTAAGLGEDAASWSRLFGPLSRNFDDLARDVLRPIVHLPAHPLKLAQFGSNAALPATWTARRWSSDEARALFGGVAAHLFGSLTAPLSSSAGLLLAAVAHAHGWPVAEGGSQSISNAMARKLDDLGGTITTGVTVNSADEFSGADIVMLDTAPDAAARILGDRLPERIRRAYQTYRFGPAAFKIDFAIDGDIPWINPDVGRAGTVHLGGTLSEIVAAEQQTVDGIMPTKPFCLLAQQYLADPSRSAGGLNPIWVYAHVPHGYRGDATAAITAQIERFAPGFGKQIRHTFVRDVSAMEAYNPNYVGGDISAGANTGWQVAMRPRAAVNPYKTGVDGVYLCSSSTPPGGGVHGMCGFNAATAALAALR